MFIQTEFIIHILFLISNLIPNTFTFKYQFDACCSELITIWQIQAETYFTQHTHIHYIQGGHMKY